MSLEFHTKRDTYPSSIRKALLGGTCLLYGVCAAAGAQAAGFALKEQSASAQGNSFAGATAGAEDITYMFFNPAGLTRHEGVQAAAVVSHIWVKAKTDDAANVFADGEASQDGGQSAVVPAAYGLWSISPDLKLGLGVNVPFGLATEYSETWAGRHYAVDSRIRTINVNPAVAYRINQNLSVAVGLQAQMIDVTLSNVIPVAETLFKVEGDDWAYGFNLGAMYEFSPDTRVGLSYRSRIEHEVEGDANFGPGSTGVNADVTMPDLAQIGIYHDLSPEFAMMGEVGWTGWSTLDQLVINLDSDVGLGTTTLSQPYDWEDSWFVALGATWRPNDKWTLRGGAAFDQSPVPDETRTPRLPGEDRTWVSVGLRYNALPSLAIDAGYTHIFVKDATVDLTSPVPFTASFENAVDILTAQLAIKF